MRQKYFSHKTPKHHLIIIIFFGKRFSVIFDCVSLFYISYSEYCEKNVNGTQYYIIFYGRHIKYGIESQSKLIKSIQIFFFSFSFFHFSSSHTHLSFRAFLYSAFTFHYNSREKYSMQNNGNSLVSLNNFYSLRPLFFISPYIFTDSCLFFLASERRKSNLYSDDIFDDKNLLLKIFSR